MRDTIKKYATRHYDFSTILGEKDPSQTGPGAIPDQSKAFKIFLGFLRALPFLCIAGFIFSLVWQYVIRVYWLPLPEGQEDIWGDLIVAVSVSGLIGFGTNWLAIKMLFRPLEKRPIWGQGLIPAQRDRIIGQLAKGIHQHILNQDLIQKRIEESGIISRIEEIVLKGTLKLIEDKEFHADVKRIVHDYLRDYLAQEEVRKEFSGHIDAKLEENIQGGLKGYLFKTYKSMSREDYDTMLDNLILSLPQTAVDAISALEGSINKFSDYLQSREGDIETFITAIITDVLYRVDIRMLLEKQMEHFREEELERMIRNATDEQLVYIQYLGTLLGIFGGLLIWNRWVAVIYLAIIAILFGLDVFIFRLQKRKKQNVTEEVEIEKID